MFLAGKKYVETKNVSSFVFPEGDVKKRIKELVPETGKKDYKEIIDSIIKEYVALGVHLQTDEILRCIKEVDVEWHPIPKTVEVVFEP